MPASVPWRTAKNILEIFGLEAEPPTHRETKDPRPPGSLEEDFRPLCPWLQGVNDDDDDPEIYDGRMNAAITDAKSHGDVHVESETDSYPRPELIPERRQLSPPPRRPRSPERPPEASLPPVAETEIDRER